MYGVELKKKAFSTLEKELFLNIIQKYDTILTSKETNATSALKKKHSWVKITEEFNEASIVTNKACTKQLIKLWYNMKAKAREAKTKQNMRQLTGGGPSIEDMDPIDTKVMDIDQNILTNIEVDIDSDVDGTVVIVGDTNNQAWLKTSSEVTQEEKEEDKKKGENVKTPLKRSYDNVKLNKIDSMKCQILQEELEFKRKLHAEELKMKVLEREHKEKIFHLEVQIKLKELEKMENE